MTRVKEEVGAKIECLLARYWRVSTADAYANVKHERDGWSVDIRNNDGDHIQWAGVWATKRDAVQSAVRTLERFS